MVERIVFQPMVLAQLDIHMQKKKVIPTSHHIQELTKKWIKDLNKGEKN